MDTIRKILVLCPFLLLGACAERSYSSMEQGVIGGGALGAGLGAIVGNQVGNTASGLAIGGAAGSLAGGTMGHTADGLELRQAEQDERIRRQAEQIEIQQREIDEMKRSGVGEKARTNYW